MRNSEERIRLMHRRADSLRREKDKRILAGAGSAGLLLLAGCAAKPAPAPEGDGDLLWLRCTDGTLRAFDGVSGLVAFPAALKRPVRGAELRRIGDTDYLVFRR